MRAAQAEIEKLKGKREEDGLNNDTNSPMNDDKSTSKKKRKKKNKNKETE